MIKISNQYINRFKRARHEYLYPVSNGIYLAFDSNTLKYIGVELFYQPYNNNYENEACEVLSNLLAKGLLETV